MVRRGAVARMVAIGIAAAVLITLVAVLIPWLPTSASEEMDRITFAFWFTTVISIAITALVVAVILYSVWAFRAQPEDDTDGPPIHGSTTLEIAWTVVPAVLVIAIGTISAVVISRNGDAGSNALPVKIFAQQFAWRFEYPNAGGLRSYELVLPVGRSVKFEMTSSDVIHSFWVPEMGQKQDLLPGVRTKIVVTPTRKGRFTVICTELCGLGHAAMRAPVRVVSPAEFDQWVQERQGSGGASTDGSALFATAGCGGCHTFTPAGSSGKIGPKLDDLAARAAKEGVPLQEFVRQSIVEPNAVVSPGFGPDVMPQNFGDSLKPGEVDALVSFLTAKRG